MSTWQRMALAHRCVSDSFGARLSSLPVGLAWLALRGADRLAVGLDRLLFPAVEVREPVIVVGLPRSGSTFLHRFLVDERVGVGQELWRLMLPSPSLQALARPCLPLLERFGPARLVHPAIHRTGLRLPESDDAASLFRHFDGSLLHAYGLSHAPDDLLHAVDPVASARRDLAALEDQWRRTLAGTGESRVVARSSSAMARLPALQQAFPDARVVLLRRDPQQVVPSALSAVVSTLHARFGFWGRPGELRARTVEHLYRGLLALEVQLVQDWNAGRVDRDRVHVLAYEDLVGAFDDAAPELLRFLDHAVSPGLAARIVGAGAAQRRRSSAHRYDLARFGLDGERVRDDFGALRLDGAGEALSPR